MSGAFDAVKDKMGRFWHEAVLGNGRDEDFKPAPEKATSALLATHSLGSMLRYDQYDPETGLFYNISSVSFCFEVLPQTGADDDMAARLQTIFTPIPPGYGIQWTLFGSPDNDVNFDRYVDLRRAASDGGEAAEFFVEMAERRVSFLKKGTARPLFPNDNFSIRNIRLIFSVTRSGTKEDKKLVAEMAELKETLRATLRTANLPGFPMDGEAFINFLKPILNPESMFSGEDYYWQNYDAGKAIRNQVVRFGQPVRVKSHGLIFGEPDEENGDAEIEMRPFSILNYPEKKELWEMSNIIGAFYDDGLQYPCPFLITSGIFTLDPTTVENRAQIKSARAKMNAKSKMAEYQGDLLASQAKDWEIVTHQLNQGGSMCELYHTLLLFAPKRVMNRCTQVAINIWKHERFNLGQVDCIPLPTMVASLPMTLTKNVRDDLSKFSLLSTKTTTNAVDMSPVIAEWKGAGDPVMMFYGKRGSSTFLDFYSNKQGNYNVFVAGVSGSGKSVFMNEVVSSYRSIGARVWVIDVGRSYRNQIALQKGQFIEFTPSANICINPFSWVGIDKEVDFKEEMRLLRPMIGRMCSPTEPLSDFKYSLIGEAITKVWDDYGNETNPTLIANYLLNNIKDERGGTERVAFELGKMLQPFTEEGVYGQYFNGQANISMDADMIGLELEELKNAPELRRVVLFVLTSRIAADMYLTRDRKKLCLIDEAWQLLGEDPETATFIEEGYRRARKYKGIFCVGTQGIADAFKNAASYAAYTNADWKVYLRQDRKVLENLLQEGKTSFSPAAKRMLLSLQTVEGKYSELLVSNPDGEHVVRHIPDPFSLLAASSRAEDFEEINALLANGHDTMGALNSILRKRGIHA